MTRHARGTWAVSGAHSRKPRRIPYEPRLGDIGVIPPSSIASLSAVPLLYFSFRKARGRGVRWVGRRVLGGIGERGLPKKTDLSPKKTRGLAKKTSPLPKRTRGLPKKTDPLPKKTRGLPKKTRPLPKRTRGLPKKTALSQKKTSLSPKKTSLSPKWT